MKALMTRMKDLLGFNEDFEDEEDDYEETQQIQEPAPRPRPASTLSMPPSQPRLAPVTPAPTKDKMEILNFTMSNYEMTGEVATYIKNRKPIIVNMEKLVPHEMQRAVDYLTGACFALNGTVEKVTDNIFIFAPEHVNINPEKINQRTGFPPTI